MSVAPDSPHPAARGARLRARPALLSLRTVRPDLVEATLRGRTLGYLEIVGNVFVVLRGERYDIAVEVLQTMTIEVATQELLRTS